MKSHDTHLGNDFFDMSLKPQATKVKTDEWEYNKL